MKSSIAQKNKVTFTSLPDMIPSIDHYTGMQSMLFKQVTQICTVGWVVLYSSEATQKHVFSESVYC